MKQILIGKSKAVNSIKRQINILAAKKDDILIIGEQGSGKSFVAHTIHDESIKGNTPKQPVELKPANIAGEELTALLETPIDKAGSLLALVNGGTIIIEEIEKATFKKQIKILEFLNYIDTLRGRSNNTKFKTRVVITTKNDPAKLSTKKQLVSDLANYFSRFTRLFVPPLKDRKEDIPYLAEHFINEACERIGIEKPVIDINAINVLTNHTWKHNIRELKTVIDQSVLFSTNGTFALPPDMVESNAKVTRMLGMILTGEQQEVDGSLDTIERNLISSTLKRCDFNFSKAAEFLGMNTQKLKHRITKLGIQHGKS